jgi:hypothetical protein
MMVSRRKRTRVEKNPKQRPHRQPATAKLKIDAALAAPPSSCAGPYVPREVHVTPTYSFPPKPYTIYRPPSPSSSYATCREASPPVLFTTCRPSSPPGPYFSYRTSSPDPYASCRPPSPSFYATYYRPPSLPYQHAICRPPSSLSVSSSLSHDSENHDSDNAAREEGARTMFGCLFDLYPSSTLPEDESPRRRGVSCE